MKTKNYFLVILISFLSITYQSRGQAELQVIHNAADPAAASVDIYINGTIALDDFAFRQATPFLPLPSGVNIDVGVAPGNSSSVADTLVNFPVVLASGQKYVAIANGVLNPASFAVNPDSRSTAFTLFIQDNIRTQATMMNMVDLIAVHGSTDAPTVDVEARNIATLVDDAAYGDITSYFSVPPASYILDVTPAAGSPIVASFAADLSTLGGGAAVVFASGFLDPSSNQNGEAFGLFAALTDGTVLQLPSVSTARLQVIHNAADPAAATVDVYVNGVNTLDDFAFRTATPYIDVPAGVVLNIGVAPGNSTSVTDTLKNFEVTLDNGGTYLAVANGVLNPASFATNPDSRPTAFTLFLADSMLENGTTANVDLIAIHGATDAPTVDVKARNVATLVDNAAYGDITSYFSVPPASYILDVTPGAGSPIVASFAADLSTLGGGAAVVFASGFLDPSTNQNGEAFGLFAALSDGTVLQLPAVSTARLQVIHNAADPAAATVDVYVNGVNTLNDFAFRTATPYIDVPAGVVLNIGVAPGNSTSVTDTLKNFEVTLANGGTYLAVANGVLNPASFAVNPDSRPTAFTLLLADSMRENASTGNVDLRVIHGSSDAPTVDVLTSSNVLVDNAAYTDITGYLTVPAANYILDITPGNNNSTILLSYSAPLSALSGNSAVVLASGFLNPAANQNGAGFTLIAVLADGTVVPLSIVTGVSDKEFENSINLFPNPAHGMFSLNSSDFKIRNMEIRNLMGETMLQQNDAFDKIDISKLTAGMYFVTIEGEKNTVTRRLMVQ